VVIWIVLFVTNKQVLVWETYYTEKDCEDEKGRIKFTFQYRNKTIEGESPAHLFRQEPKEINALISEKLDSIYFSNNYAIPPTIYLTCEDVPHRLLDCRYFTGRKIVRKHLSATKFKSCPNYQEIN